MKILQFDYLQAERDGEILKDYLIEQLPRFTSCEQMQTYIKSFDGFWQDVRNEIIKQKGVKRFSEIEDYKWIMEYLDFLADRDMSKAMNKGLGTKNKKYADYEKFFSKYSKVA